MGGQAEHGGRAELRRWTSELGRSRELEFVERSTGKRRDKQRKRSEICKAGPPHLWLNIKLSVYKVKLCEVGPQTTTESCKLKILKAHTELGNVHFWKRLCEEMLLNTWGLQ